MQNELQMLFHIVFNFLFLLWIRFLTNSWKTMNLCSWYCINNTPSVLHISFSLWMSQCEDFGSCDGLLNSLSFFSREVKSLISSLHSFNIQMSFGRPGLRAGGWKNFSINFIPTDSRETHVARLHCTASSPQHVVLFFSIAIEPFLNTIASCSTLFCAW